MQAGIVFKPEEAMKKLSVVATFFALLLVCGSSWAIDETTISTNVDSIVQSIDSGKDITAIKADAYEPYAFVMEEDGNMLVHPTLTGANLKEKALPVYTALQQANSDGVWIDYEWQGKMKHTYAKKTKGNLIVGSGY